MGWQFWRKRSYFVDKAEAADLPALAEIHAAGFPHGWDEDTLAGLFGSHGMIAWVARAEGGKGRPLGFVLVRNTGEEAEIITIATRRSVRGRGVGHALMNQAILELRREGTRRLFLEVAENNEAALGLYRSLGFRQVGTRKGYYTSHLADAGSEQAASASDASSAPNASSAPSAPSAPSALVMERVLR
jgi:ribosomal-protein-alanine N-acetyltransferase